MSVVKVNADVSKISEYHRYGAGFQNSKITYGDEAIKYYLEKMAHINNDRRAQWTYHAYSKLDSEWTLENIQHILNWCVAYNQALAIWENFESSRIIFCVKDPDYGHEEVGTALYQYMQGHYEAYGLAHYTEWDNYGVQVNASNGVQPSATGTGFIMSALDGDLVVI